MTESILKLSVIVALFGGTTFFAWHGFACAQSAKPGQAKAQASKSNGIIGYLQTRDYRITIKAGGLYTIVGNDGKIVAENVTLKELQARNPALNDILRRAVARGSANDDARVYPNNDAGLWMKHPSHTLSGTAKPLR